MLNKLKSQKGITGIDLTISIIIIMMFVSIIAALSMNVSSSLSSKRRLEIASNCMTEIMEKVDSMNYEDVEVISTETFEPGTIKEGYPEKSLRKEIQDIVNKKNENNELVYKILKVSIKVENYKPEGEEDDLIKKVTVIITYKQNNKDEGMEITRLKTRYNVNLEGPYASEVN